jgi:hypothetical protein
LPGRFSLARSLRGESLLELLDELEPEDALVPLGAALLFLTVRPMWCARAKLGTRSSER